MLVGGNEMRNYLDTFYFGNEYDKSNYLQELCDYISENHFLIYRGCPTIAVSNKSLALFSILSSNSSPFYLDFELLDSLYILRKIYQEVF